MYNIFPPRRYRFTHAKQLFLGAFISSRSSSGQMKEGRKLIGHVCGTQSPLTYYTKESMSDHIPFSPSICIHSVCLLEPYRKKGIGSRMMREFISRRSDVVNLIEGKPERLLLLSHGDMRRFYERLGFMCKGKSDVVLGREVWYEMRLDLERN
ncbi:hypothetical protein AGABI1DRAFT_42523 [Agaricus bisporus var. burnettii JB137-S8]|uniref:N-acetyltransferase domain-containing protein n=1 Tax=Agaricus bisporus var. burnettii (strain JB137-S8 / ATCC MYA-4627 / FGSC 10392) TaxID=597362 RepID=K5X590_AGABU|nr:uncharacterized protein AGABI1DRAFT_42523 [Agaricus bisporus var. burnettii JB137-S8]EKM78072.1 hypothetical protein AGABI1DRAFT_42523 [Agaricus bisporus var. burnettii JB137-S8]